MKFIGETPFVNAPINYCGQVQNCDGGACNCASCSSYDGVYRNSNGTNFGAELQPAPAPSPAPAKQSAWDWLKGNAGTIITAGTGIYSGLKATPKPGDPGYTYDTQIGARPTDEDAKSKKILTWTILGIVALVIVYIVIKMRK
jgi:hypothetical protein